MYESKIYEIIIFFIFANGNKDTFNFANGFSNVATCEQYIESNESEIDKIMDEIIGDNEGSSSALCYPQRKTVSI